MKSAMMFVLACVVPFSGFTENAEELALKAWAEFVQVAFDNRKLRLRRMQHILFGRLGADASENKSVAHVGRSRCPVSAVGGTSISKLNALINIDDRSGRGYVGCLQIRRRFA